MCVGWFALVSLSGAVIAGEPIERSASGSLKYFDIPPQALDTALIVCAEQAGVQILFRADLLKGRQSPGIKGLYDPAAAIAALLNSTGFRFEFSGARTVIVSAAPTGTRGVPQPLPRNHSQN